VRLGSRFIDTITERRRAVIAVMLVTTLVLSGGVAALEQSSSLDQFKSDGPETDRLEYAEEHFGAEGDTTTAQLFVRDDNVLSKGSLIATLELQRDIREDETVEPTLADDAVDDLSTVAATAAIREERAEALEDREERLEEDRVEVEGTAEELVDVLDEARELQTEYDELNAAHEAGEVDDDAYEVEAERIDEEFEAIDERAESTLTEEQHASFEPVLAETRELQSELFGVEAAYERGEIDADERDERTEELGEELEASYAAIEEEVLAEEFDALEERADDLEADADELEELDPTLDEQIEQLESMEESEIEELLETILDRDDGQSEAFVFLPTDYEPGSTEADARLLFVTQRTDGQAVIAGEASDEIVDSQLAMDAMVEERFDEGFVFGDGIATDEIDRSLVDSLWLVLPFSLLFVCLVLTVAYRDPLDIVLGLAGIVVVLLWTLGFMGWAGIPFTQIMVAVPALLVGLSIDYAIHVFMRHRERRGETEGDSSAVAMRTVLAGLGIALVWVTATAAFGFLSNLVSPVAPIREFGLVSAVGIVSALLVFGALIPAAKVELDALLEARGYDRRRRAFGTDGTFAGLLSVGERVAYRAPLAVLFAVLLVTAAGAYGATDVDTTFEQEDFIADDPSAWTASLPGPLATGEYGANENIDTLNEHAARQDTRTQVVITGDVTGDRTLERVDDARDVAADRGTSLALANGDAGVSDPLSVMRDVAAENESFDEAFSEADTTGDGVPDEDVAAVYDALFEADEARANEVIYRTDDGEYEALRTVVTVQGDAPSAAATDDAREVASVLDGDGLEATATGQPVVFSVVEEELFETVIQSLALTLGAVAVLLALVYRRTVGSASLGVVTLAPIVCSVAWILGTMALLGVPFNAVTGTITSLTVGLGVAYNIHMTERYLLERRHGHDPREALGRSVRGTGGALLGSAATTVGGFGVLAFAILPPLQQFGLVTGLTIVYAFVGSVFVLPSLLVLWTRYARPDVVPAVDHSAEGEGETTAADGGWG
jgi:predicted RND superfamily exporter protein